ncbi:MAG: AAA family ATPase [Hyphomonas sp.]
MSTATNQKFRAAVITGAPGTGKTSIVSKLTIRARCIPEAARRVLKHAHKHGGDATGDQNPAAFIEAMSAAMRDDLSFAKSSNAPIIFDRSLPDLIAYARWYEEMEKVKLPRHISPTSLERLCRQEMPKIAVFHCPVWDQIFTQDEERKMSLIQARQFDVMIQDAYQIRLGLTLTNVPIGPPEQRAQFIAKQMAL